MLEHWSEWEQELMRDHLQTHQHPRDVFTGVAVEWGELIFLPSKAGFNCCEHSLGMGALPWVSHTREFSARCFGRCQLIEGNMLQFTGWGRQKPNQTAARMWLPGSSAASLEPLGKV